MKTTDAPVFDSHQVALELGYSEQQIEDFKNLRYVINFWGLELEEGRAESSDFPYIDAKRRHALREYYAKVSRKKFEFYINNKHLFK